MRTLTVGSVAVLLAGCTTNQYITNIIAGPDSQATYAESRVDAASGSADATTDDESSTQGTQDTSPPDANWTDVTAPPDATGADAAIQDGGDAGASLGADASPDAEGGPNTADGGDSGVGSTDARGEADAESDAEAEAAGTLAACTDSLACRTLFISESNFAPLADGSSIRFTAWIVNASITGTLALADVKFRYYFTSLLQPLGYSTHCYLAMDQNVANSGGTAITSDVNFMPGSTQSTTPGGAYYYEISFASTVPPMIAAPAGYAIVQVEIDATPGSFTPTTDYSYVAGAGASNSQATAVANAHITGYLNGVLVWGQEP